MCGIAAVLLTPKGRSPQQWQEIWQHFTENLCLNESRGREATGVAVTQSSGEIFLEKQPLPAQAFTQGATYQALTQHLTSQTVLILGHTRYPTQGTPAHNHNNHPLLVGDTLGIHNGHIHNSDDLFVGRGLTRQTEVDSEVIFRLLDDLNSPVTDLAAMARDLRLLEGKFTILALQRHHPTQLILVRHHNPLSLYYHPHWQALLFSSSYIFLRKAFGPAVRQQEVPKDQVLCFDARALATHHHHPQAACPL